MKLGLLAIPQARVKINCIETYSKHFIFMTVKHMSHEASMRMKPLASHHIAHAFLLFRHISYMIPIRVHDYIFVGLFKSAIDGICLDYANRSSYGRKILTS